MKPTAWMMVNRENTSAYLIFDTPTREQKISHQPIPLYQVKELTDEQIVGIRMTTEGDIKAFARAIIKEATA